MQCATIVRMPTTKVEPIGSREACAILRIDKSTLSRWVASGRLTPVHKLPSRNGAYLFDRADIEALKTAS